MQYGVCNFPGKQPRTRQPDLIDSQIKLLSRTGTENGTAGPDFTDLASEGSLLRHPKRMLGSGGHDLLPLSPSLITGSLSFFPFSPRLSLVVGGRDCDDSDTMTMSMTNESGMDACAKYCLPHGDPCASPGVASRPFRNDPHPQSSTFAHLIISQSTCFVERRKIEIGG